LKLRIPNETGGIRIEENEETRRKDEKDLEEEITEEERKTGRKGS